MVPVDVKVLGYEYNMLLAYSCRSRGRAYRSVVKMYAVPCNLNSISKIKHFIDIYDFI